jgi:hypothetical protein
MIVHDTLVAVAAAITTLEPRRSGCYFCSWCRRGKVASILLDVAQSACDIPSTIHVHIMALLQVFWPVPLFCCPVPWHSVGLERICHSVRCACFRVHLRFGVNCHAVLYLLGCRMQRPAGQLPDACATAHQASSNRWTACSACESCAMWVLVSSSSSTVCYQR